MPFIENGFVYFFTCVGVAASLVFGMIWLCASMRILCLYAQWQLDEAIKALKTKKQLKREDVIKLIEMVDRIPDKARGVE